MQYLGLINFIKTAQQIIDNTAAEFFAITLRLGALGQGKVFG